MKKESIIFSLGGSLIVPDKIDAKFLAGFREVILKHLRKYKQVIIVAGGGKTARRYQEAARQISGIDVEDLDWIGIHSSRLNGHLMRTIFKDHAYAHMIFDPKKMTTKKSKIIIGAGYKPGNSTDYVATLFAKAYKVKTVVNLSNIDYVYDKDPYKFEDAQPQKHMHWKDFKKMVGTEWTPGANTPFDPVATKLSAKLGLKVIVMKGSNLNNLDKFLQGKNYKGTEIS